MRGSLRRRDTHRLRAISWVDPCTIEKKSHRGGCFPLALAEGVHKLRKLGGAFDFKEDLVVVVRDLNIQVFTLGLLVRVANGTGGLITIRHGQRWQFVVL